MSGESNERGDMSVLAVATGSMRGRPSSIEERRRLVAESLQVGNPGNRAKELPEQADPRHDCQIELRVDDIRPYENNPRRANNAKFSEIKESIRSTGIRNPLTVTRRPGEQHFIVEAGGNTRLLAVQQLWAETRDPRFEKLTVVFRPWRSEGHVLVAHLIENEQRGELTFWDKANGVVALKEQFEEEKGRPLSLRQLEEELKAAGFSINTATLAHYLYVTARLGILGDAIPALSHQDVKTIQPRLNLMKRYAQMRGAMDEAALYAVVFEPVFRRHADRYRETGTFSAADLCQACEDALARHVGEEVARFRMVLDALAQSPQAASLDSLLETGPVASASGVNGVNSISGRTERQAVLDASGRAANGAPVMRSLPKISSVNGVNSTGERTEPQQAPHESWHLNRLQACTRRFAELAVRQGLEERARSLLALVHGLLSESVRVQFAKTSALTIADSLEPLALDDRFFDWLLDGRDEAAAAFWEIAALVRDLRSGSQ